MTEQKSTPLLLSFNGQIEFIEQKQKLLYTCDPSIKQDVQEIQGVKTVFPLSTKGDYSKKTIKLDIQQIKQKINSLTKK